MTTRTGLERDKNPCYSYQLYIAPPYYNNIATGRNPEKLMWLMSTFFDPIPFSIA
jgi:hypothetical protein